MKKKNRIDQLIEEQSTVSNAALKNALTRQIEEETKASEERLLKQFNDAKKLLNNEVINLRAIRSAEKRAVKSVKAVDAAYEQFKKDGDYNAFLKVCYNT